MTTRNHDVDFLGPGGNAFLNLGHPQPERRQARRKAGGDCRHRNVCAAQCLNSRFDHVMVYANRADMQVIHPKRIQKVRPHRLACLGT